MRQLARDEGNQHSGPPAKSSRTGRPPAQALPFAGLLPTCTSPASRRRKPLPVERTSPRLGHGLAESSFALRQGELLGRRSALAHTSCRPQRALRVHRGLVQSAPAAPHPRLPHFRATAAWPATAQPQVARPTTRSQRAACAPHRWRPSIRTSPRSKSGHEPTPFVVAGPLSSVCYTGCEVFVWAEVR
jgi:hypothetical protein